MSELKQKLDPENLPAGDTPKRPKLEELSEEDLLNQEISNQVNYYFSDVNVINDKFLKEQIKENDEGLVPLDVLMTFKKLKDLTTKEEIVLKALERFPSEVIDVVVDKEKGKKGIKRKDPLPGDEIKAKFEKRTLHLTGFPQTYTYEDLYNFCQTLGEVESLKKRHHFKTQMFKGCIHVVFKTKADVDKILNLEVLMCKDREIRRESMQKYHVRKEEMKKKREENRKTKKDTRRSKNSASAKSAETDD